MFLLNYLKLYCFRKKYRKLNMHNYTTIVNFCDLSKIEIGEKTYGEINVFNESLGDTKLYIGNYCSIAHGVTFLLGGEHYLKGVSTYPFKVKCFGYEREAFSKGNIVIKDDVWICSNAIICSGVTVGQGAVIAAGAVVTKDVEPYSIVGGNPAHFIKWRVNESLRSQLIGIDLKQLFSKFNKKDLETIYSPITEETLKSLLTSVK